MSDEDLPPFWKQYLKKLAILTIAIVGFNVYFAFQFQVEDTSLDPQEVRSTVTILSWLAFVFIAAILAVTVWWERKSHRKALKAQKEFAETPIPDPATIASLPRSWFRVKLTVFYVWLFVFAAWMLLSPTNPEGEKEGFRIVWLINLLVIVTAFRAKCEGCKVPLFDAVDEGETQWFRQLFSFTRAEKCPRCGLERH
jgi:hypothetical protein